MKNTAILPFHAPESHSSVKINRLASVEEELTDRLVREKNGQRVYQFCQKLGALMIVSYSPNDDNIAELRDNFCVKLAHSLKCSHHQASTLIDIALDLVHARIYNNYRRTYLDISFLVATASGALREGSPISA